MNKCFYISHDYATQEMAVMINVPQDKLRAINGAVCETFTFG